MSNPVERLVLDLLEWLEARPRTYREVMEAWRTSCPALPVWEEADERGLVERVRDHARGEIVTVTAKGRSFLAQARPGS